MDKQQDINRASEQRIPIFWWALVFAVASVLMTGYRVYFHNQTLQIPLVKMLNDPSLYPNDPFAATLPYYASIIWRIIAWCARIAPLEKILLTFFLLERFLIVYAAGYLATTLAPKSKLAMAGAMAFIATDPVPIIGGGTILMPYFEQTSLAVAFFMLAMAAFYRRKPFAWAIWLALGFNCNSMYGVYALTYFGAAFIMRRTESREQRASIKEWLSALGLFAVLSIPALIISFAAFGKGQVSTDLWLAASRARVPHHIFPSVWPWIKYARFTVLMLAIGFGLVYARFSASLRRQVMVWMTVSVGWVMFAIAAEMMRSPSMMILQPARATDLWYCFGVIALMAACLGSTEKPMLFALALVPFALFHPFGGYIELAIATVLVVLVAVPIHNSNSTIHNSNTRPAIALAAFILILSFIAVDVRAHIYKSYSEAMVKRPSCSILRICRWARKNTPKNAMFLVNPNISEFRSLSGRPEFVTWKDGSALLWDRPFAIPWSQRMQALGYDVTKGHLPGQQINNQLDNLYNSLTDSAVRRLASRYGIRYWIVPTKHKSSLPVAYQNRYLKALEIARAHE